MSNVYNGRRLAKREVHKLQPRVGSMPLLEPAVTAFYAHQAYGVFRA